MGLVDRPWNTALAFLPPAAQGSGDDGSNSSGGGGTPGSRVLVGTGNHKVRLYDADAGKRPQVRGWGYRAVAGFLFGFWRILSESSGDSAALPLRHSPPCCLQTQIDLTWREARVTCMALEPQGRGGPGSRCLRASAPAR